MPRGTNWIASTSFVRWLPGLLAVIVGLSLTIFGPAAAFGASPTSPATAEVLASYSYDTASNGLESTVAAAFGEARARIPAVTSSVVSTGEVSAFPVDTVAAETADGAANVANGVRLRAQLTGEQISGGHAFADHVVKAGEFPGITTRQEFAARIEGVVTNGESRQLLRGRTAYFEGNTVVIRDPASLDGGSAFVPTGGYNYFLGLK